MKIVVDSEEQAAWLLRELDRIIDGDLWSALLLSKITKSWAAQSDAYWGKNVSDGRAKSRVTRAIRGAALQGIGESDSYYIQNAPTDDVGENDRWLWTGSLRAAIARVASRSMTSITLDPSDTYTGPMDASMVQEAYLDAAESSLGHDLYNPEHFADNIAKQALDDHIDETLEELSLRATNA